jgi:hypothetical protein
MKPTHAASIAIALFASLFAGSAAAQRTDAGASGDEPFLEDIVQLTTSDRFSRAGEAYFSPSSDWIVFQAVPAGEEVSVDGSPRYAMFVAPLERDASGVTGMGDPIRVSPDGSANTCGWFHPTLPGVILFGSTVEPHTPRSEGAYQRDGSRYSWEFPRSMDVVTRTVPEIVRDQVQEPALRRSLLRRADVRRPVRLWERDGYDAEGSWSPDGRFVLFTAVDPSTGDGDIFIRDLAGGRSIPLVTAEGYDGGPFFSPDGTRITYRSDRRGDDLLQVFVADLVFDDRGVPTGIANETQLTDNEHVNWAPFWHPSGDYLLYATSQVSHMNYEVFAVPSRSPGQSTPSPARVTRAAGFDGLPVFSPDGSLMMWTAQRSSDASQLYIASTASTVPDNLEIPESSAPTSASASAGAASVRDALAAASPTARRFLEHVTILASDWLGGRFPGSPGIEVAERYIRDRYIEAGLVPAFTDDAGTPRFFQPFTIPLPGEDCRVVARNTGALLAGKGDLADRYLVLGAHHDHIGVGTVGSRSGEGEIHEGADDNASGAAMVLLLAERLAAAYDRMPDDADARTVLFTTFSAEELGLIGARHLAENSPVDLARTDAMLNFDMVGRITDNRISLSGLASGEALRDLVSPAIEASPMTVVTPDSLTSRSDHAAFYTRGVPSLFFIIDPFHDDYHTAEDESWRLNPDGAALLADLAEGVATRIATHAEPIAFSEIEGFGGRRDSPMADVKVRFGIMPGNYGGDGGGVLIERVAGGTSASEAGIEDGDRLVAWDGREVEGIRAWMGMLAEHEPGDTVTVTVVRDGERVELPVTLKAR